MATVTVASDLTDLGSSHGVLRYYKVFEVDWENLLPKGVTSLKEVIFSHVTIASYNGEFATCIPYLKNSTASQQIIPRQWSLYCSKNTYCYPTFYILY